MDQRDEVAPHQLIPLHQPSCRAGEAQVMVLPYLAEPSSLFHLSDAGGCRHGGCQEDLARR
jgi:hypothetical protein